MPDLTLQPILGTDKKNECFSVFKSTSDPAKLEVYFGMALLEKVNNDASSLLFKMLVGRLYNARIKVKTLEVAFELDRSTFRRWGEVLNSGDDDEIVRVLSSSGGTKKITPEIDRFIREEFQQIYPHNSYSYSSAIRNKIKKIFKVELSGEAVRPIFNEEKARIKESIEKHKTPASTEDSCCLSSEQKNESDCSVLEEPASTSIIADKPQAINSNTSQVINSGKSQIQESSLCSVKVEESGCIEGTETGVSGCGSENDTTSKTGNNRKHSLPFCTIDNRQKQFFHHAGLLLLLPSILKFAVHVDQRIVLQWMSTVLLGAQNIEQTASLDLGSLTAFLNQNVITSLKQQRFCLRSMCIADVVRAVLKANIIYCGPSEQNIFYYDPHSMPYTGLKKILKGWCGSLGKTAKVNYHDFIHNFKGEPVWFECFDNYLDLRERFTGVLSNFADAAGLQPQQMTTIVDRGIYSKERMEAIHKAGFGLVTWQKNYTDKSWDMSKDHSRFSISRCRNNSRDIKHWQIEFYRDDSWKAVKGYHRIIVRILAPGKKKTAQLSILSNDTCPDRFAVYAMLNRWIQENDFAYLIRHFGINMITTYDSECYSDIDEELVKKDVYSDAYITIKKAVASIESRIKTILLRRETKEATGKLLSKKDKEKLEVLKEQLAIKKEELKGVEEKEDKLEKLAETGTRRLKLAPKVLMDAVKISARNIFYSHVEPFRNHFDNYRNDHKIFRELTRSPGYIHRNNEKITVELNPARNFEPKEQLLIQSFLDKIGAENEHMHISFKLC